MKIFTKRVHREHEVEEKLSLKDIDEPLQKNYRLKLIEAFALCASGIILGIMLKSITFIIAVAITVLVIVGVIWYQILRVLEGDVYRFEGICVETYKDDDDMKITDRKYLILQTKEGYYIKIYNDNAAKRSKKNNVITFYALSNSLRQINDDSFQADSYYYLYVSKTNGYEEYFESSEETMDET